ncbi:ATPase subunit of ABC transporter with duplicated ATPase domains [Propionibacteriaceae bacterium ES.041]|uniref:ABC-F family ATP-binding cassette domain-containing protein n=1 Tax=Enemella evansiae TaxID=2016499 RepID=UPI000B96616B|nr:ABC-F family ATP-binding cassette domain-containing protein [Enemella evansiae]OYN95750.1 glycerophosphodiester phosphodiesterase [Enemella evansiae]PFG68054.1 ATPase subunit of ABC transporter with duplicated ATPase domains [Propionibacteriaceae bacterium ES.041]
MPAANLVNAEKISKVYGTRTILDEVSVGLGRGDVIGVVGRNGDGKSTLLGALTGRIEPDSGRVTRTGSVSIGSLDQVDSYAPSATVREVIVDGQPDHVWAADSYRRGVVQHLLADIDLDAELGRLSGGERRRTALVAVMLGQHDLLVLDEPTNHLDVEAVAWLAEHLRTLQQRDVAMLVVSHDRWFLDAICTRIWEVHDGVVDAYEGGYAAYTLARAERSRQAAANEARRQNLVRKELAWLRRGAPARTSKPKFRIEEANRLIEDVPPPRDKLALERFAVTRLGKDVFDLTEMSYALPDAPGSDGRVLFDHLNWSIGPGDRIGLVGVNGAGKTTLLKLLSGELSPGSGRVKQGKTLRLGHLTQAVRELDDSDRVLDNVNRLKAETKLATGRETSASQLLEEFGFTGNRLTTRIGDLSGGERRRLQLLRLLMSEPNVLLLDEPTNDLDIDTLTVVEDYLDSWPGTLIVVSHDRYFLERVTDVTYALMGDGSCVLLPGGVEQYLDHRRSRPQSGPQRTERSAAAQPSAPAGPSAAALRQAKKDLARLEQQLARLSGRIDALHGQMAEAASDYQRLAELQAEADRLQAEHDQLEEDWLAVAELVES